MVETMSVNTCLVALLLQELEGLQMQEQPGGQLELLRDPLKPDWQVRSTAVPYW